ncbi:hypothetical protein [Mesorhizobium sp. NBSH29]|uniref:hypothetical protein n=1 Tax=Mesorhizobium sp. NBSH29 TaxID=2654249 RepID=UPI0027E51506|nr:hypothetical protein [Mesorhizobium sp. NBSH29]
MMEKVQGIGGFFFRSTRPSGLAKWYFDHLGVDPVPADYCMKVWEQEAGPTVFAPFPDNSNYFGNATQQWMINFRVGNLDAIVTQAAIR